MASELKQLFETRTTLFTFESMRTSIYPMSKMLNACTFILILSAFASVGCRTSLLTDCSTLLTAVFGNSGIETIYTDSWKEDVFADLNRFYTNNGIKEMLGETDFVKLNSVLAYAPAFVDRRMGQQHSHPMTLTHKNIFEIQHLLDRKIWDMT